MYVIEKDLFADAYADWLYDILYNYEYETAPRGKKIREISNMCMIIGDPSYELFKNGVRNIPLHYLAGELIWYFSGRNDVEFIKNYSKFWEHIKNPDGKTVNSAYGNLLFVEQPNQWYWAKNSLIKDKDTRQAILHFNKPQHQFEGNKDFVCTMYGKFDIRNDYLNFYIAMRSSDAIRGITFDIPFFILLQKAMLLELKETYPELKLGTFTFFTNSAHIYEEHFTLVEQMLDKPFVEDKIPEFSESPILHPALYNIENYNGDDEFLNWLKYHS